MLLNSNKKAAKELGISKLIILILVVLVIVFVIYFLTKGNIPDVLKTIIIPFSTPKPPKPFDYFKTCPIKIAVLQQQNGDGNYYIHMCRDTQCTQKQKTDLYVSEDKILIDKPLSNDPQIGNVFRATIVFYNDVMRGVGSADHGDVFYDYWDTLPSEPDLVNLNLGYFISQNEICRDSFRTVEDSRKDFSVRSIESNGVIFYYNLDQLLSNKLKQNTDLYLDNSLSRKAKSYVDKDWNVHRLQEDGETPREEELQTKTFFSNIIIPKVSLGRELKAGEWTHDLPMNPPIDNTNNKLGIDSGSDDFEFFKLREYNGRIYIQLIDRDGIDTESPWILLDYWNAYRSFGRVPQWARI